MAHLLVNPRSKVFFEGWESDTYRLGQRGWKISVQENFEQSQFDLMAHHVHANLVMYAISREHPMREHKYRMTAVQSWRDQYESRSSFDGCDGPEFTVVRVFVNNPNLTVYHPMPIFHSWSETRPAMIDVDPQTYNPFDFPIFLKKGEPAPQELIVEPQDVMQLLEQIKQMQSPEQAEIRKRRKAVPLAHATILSFGEAA